LVFYWRRAVNRELEVNLLRSGSLLLDHLYLSCWLSSRRAEASRLYK
jgi:hypothetical protein